MPYFVIALAAAAAAQTAAPQGSVKWVLLQGQQTQSQADARAQGFAQGQAALNGQAAPQGAVQFTPAAASPIAAPTYTSAILRVGTEVPLRLSQELTTKGKQLRVGDRFHLETSEPVLVQGVNVIPVGSPAVGELTDVRNKGMWGKSGHLAARLLYVTVNGRQIRLSGAFDEKGTAGGVGAVAVSAIVFLPAGFFMTGTSARIPAGSIVKGFVDEDVPLSMPVAAQSPMVVGTPAVTGNQH